MCIHWVCVFNEGSRYFYELGVINIQLLTNTNISLNINHHQQEHFTETIKYMEEMYSQRHRYTLMAFLLNVPCHEPRNAPFEEHLGPFSYKHTFYVESDNTNSRVKSHYTADLFILYGLRCFAYVELATALLSQIQTSQTGGQQYYIGILPPMVSVLR